MSTERPLHTPTRIHELLTRFDLRADKNFGQNFLIDGHVLSRIVKAAEITKEDTILEVGPGLGVLTYELGKRAKKVISLELDKRLLPILDETLAEFSNVEVIHADAMKFDFARLPEKSLLVANLPYNIATPLIAEALKTAQFTRLVFLVQKEVAERLTAKAGTKTYGAVSLLVEHFGKAKKLFDVKPSAFLPAPKVNSSVVRIDVDTNAGFVPELFKLIDISFKHRRKTLKKNLLMAGFEKDDVLEVFKDLKLDPKIRAEVLSLELFKSLAHTLTS